MGDYRQPDVPNSERISKLEDAVKGMSMKRFYEAIRIGLNIMLSLGGIATVILGGTYGLSLFAYADAEKTRAETESAEAQERIAQTSQTRVPEREQARARQECVDACERAGMSIQRARMVTDRERGSLHELWRAASCSCVAPYRHRILWNDLRASAPPTPTPPPCPCTMAEDGTLSCAVDPLPSRIRMEHHGPDGQDQED